MRALRDAGLIDADPEIERLRNIVASPLDDLDPEAAFDLGLSVAALEERLAEDERLRRLPAKFSFVLDAQGRLPLGDVDADIRFEALRTGRSRCFSAAKTRWLRQCAPRRDGRNRGAARPRVLGARRRRRSGAAADARARRARRALRPCSRRRACEAKPGARSQRRAVVARRPRRARLRRGVVVGAAAAFGEFEAVRFKALIERARALGATGLQAHALAGVPDRRPRRRAAQRQWSMRCAELGFIVDADDPRLRVAACPGAPACMHGARPRARRRGALGGVAAQGRRRRSPRQRLRQGMREARCDRGDLDRDRDRLRSHSRGQGRRSAGAARPFERGSRCASSPAKGASMFAAEGRGVKPATPTRRTRRRSIAGRSRSFAARPTLRASRRLKSGSRCGSSMPAAWWRRPATSSSRRARRRPRARRFAPARRSSAMRAWSPKGSRAPACLRTTT